MKRTKDDWEFLLVPALIYTLCCWVIFLAPIMGGIDVSLYPFIIPILMSAVTIFYIYKYQTTE